MPLYRFNGEKYEKVGDIHVKKEKVVEVHLEKHVAKDPMLLGEPLFVLGRKVPVGQTQIDILALDVQGDAVVVAIDRRDQKEPVLVRALRGAGGVADWSMDDFKRVSEAYHEIIEDYEFDFDARLKAFCEENGLEEVPLINRDQRVVLVGLEVRNKYHDVAGWLKSHNIDIKLIRVHPYKAVRKTEVH